MPPLPRPVRARRPSLKAPARALEVLEARQLL